MMSGYSTLSMVFRGGISGYSSCLIRSKMAANTDLFADERVPPLLLLWPQPVPEHKSERLVRVLHQVSNDIDSSHVRPQYRSKMLLIPSSTPSVFTFAPLASSRSALY